MGGIEAWIIKLQNKAVEDSREMGKKIKRSKDNLKDHLMLGQHQVEYHSQNRGSKRRRR